jgi:diamine N-acetyltransferase
MTPGAVPAVTLRRASLDDAALLRALATSTFHDTFAADNTPDDMVRYTLEAFGEGAQQAEIADARNTVWLAERDAEAVGYAMLREGEAPECVPAGDTIEIARLYSVRRWIGAGIGAALMQRCLDDAVARGKRSIWLGVWERNARAIAFYQRWGFEDVGIQSFRLGHDVQTDRVMARVLDGRA